MHRPTDTTTQAEHELLQEAFYSLMTKLTSQQQIYQRAVLCAVGQVTSIYRLVASIWPSTKAGCICKKDGKYLQRVKMHIT